MPNSRHEEIERERWSWSERVSARAREQQLLCLSLPLLFTTTILVVVIRVFVSVHWDRVDSVLSEELWFLGHPCSLGPALFPRMLFAPSLRSFSSLPRSLFLFTFCFLFFALLFISKRLAKFLLFFSFNSLHAHPLSNSSAFSPLSTSSWELFV